MKLKHTVHSVQLHQISCSSCLSHLSYNLGPLQYLSHVITCSFPMKTFIPSFMFNWLYLPVKSSQLFYLSKKDIIFANCHALLAVLPVAPGTICSNCNMLSAVSAVTCNQLLPQSADLSDPSRAETGCRLPQPGGRLRQPERLPRAHEEYWGREEAGEPSERQDGHHESFILPHHLFPPTPHFQAGRVDKFRAFWAWVPLSVQYSSYSR